MRDKLSEIADNFARSFELTVISYSLLAISESFILCVNTQLRAAVDKSQRIFFTVSSK